MGTSIGALCLLLTCASFADAEERESGGAANGPAESTAADERAQDDAVIGSAEVVPEPALDTPELGAEHQATAALEGPSEVRWTVGAEATPAELAERWGMRTSALLALNPELSRETKVAPGATLLVFRREAERPTLSIGRPTDGKLRNGVPLPEGPNWVSKSQRFQYGSEVTVATLLEVFAKYAEAYPAGQKLRVGDLSRRGGGEIKRKHESHWSGRDADLGYVGQDETEADGWIVVSPDTLDLEKTWFLVDTLLATGRVQVIFMDKELQRALDAYVRATFPERFTREELAMLFEYPRRIHSHRAVIQHWDHHADHLHVRFVCEAGNWRCQGRGTWGE